LSWRSGWQSLRTLIATLALGLIIGGAVGKRHRPLRYGAVVDFACFHLQIGGKYLQIGTVFNLADVAIVAGVAALLYDSFLGGRRRKSALIPADTDRLG